MDNGIEYARELDAGDEISELRNEFHIPEHRGRACSYLCGHSLGLMPRAAADTVSRELDRWSRLGVAGHFDSEMGWYGFHERFAPPLAELIGADDTEVVAMNSLTVNLHLMLVSFFRPNADRHRILIESGAFPSDRFAVQSHLKYHGFDPIRDLVELGDGGLVDAGMLDDALAQDDRIALVLLPGVHYLTGQALDLGGCAAVARKHACRIGFDLAHAIGNLSVDLRASEPDFAVWCSYKFLNGGPGAIGGCFVNRRWTGDADVPRFEGWWGHDRTARFAASAVFDPPASADAWQLSNPPILSMAPLEASLAIFRRAGSNARRAKSLALTGYLEALLDGECGDRIRLITPRDPAERGAQLSVQIRSAPTEATTLVERLRAAGIIVDWRTPDTLRLAPVPLYNRFADVHAAVVALSAALGR